MSYLITDKLFELLIKFGHYTDRREPPFADFVKFLQQHLVDSSWIYGLMNKMFQSRKLRKKVSKVLSQKVSQVNIQVFNDIAFQLNAMRHSQTVDPKLADWIRQNFKGSPWPQNVLEEAHLTAVSIERSRIGYHDRLKRPELSRRLNAVVKVKSVSVPVTVDLVAPSYVTLSFPAPHQSNAWVEREFDADKLPPDLRPGDKFDIVANLYPSGALLGYETKTDAMVTRQTSGVWGVEWPEPPEHDRDPEKMAEYRRRKDAHFQALWDNA